MIDWLIRRAQRTPYFHLTGYMERYWLVPYRTLIARTVDGETHTDGTGPVAFLKRPLAWLIQRFDVAIRVHHILRSDRGRDPHDHPWPYLTVILRGGYWEHTYDADGWWKDTQWRGPGSILFRRATSLHRLEVDEGMTAWTLFITGPKKQTWGFKPVNKPKIPYWQYEGEA